MKSYNITISGRTHTSFLIVGAIIMAAILFFLDRGVATPGVPAEPTEVAADLEQYAKDVRNSLASDAGDQVEKQLVSLRDHLRDAMPSMDDFTQGIQAQAAPTIPAVESVPTVYALPTLPPASIPQATATPIPAQPTVAPPVQVALTTMQTTVQNGEKFIVTPVGLMNCREMFLQYANVVGVQYGTVFFNWFQGLSQPEGTAYYNQCWGA